jgi:calcineurin-like phosphoesterase family protein
MNSSLSWKKNQLSDIWFISDTHWDHAKFLTFLGKDGKPIRAFSSVEEMNEIMIQNWIKRVKPQDKIYHLGDVTMRPNQFARIVCRLPGHKRLIGGNHDDLKNYELTRWFEKVGIWRVFKDHNFVATHIPIPEGQFRHKVQYNVHGHIHQNLLGGPYINVCVEHTDYGPKHIDEIKAMFDRGYPNRRS